MQALGRAGVVFPNAELSVIQLRRRLCCLVDLIQLETLDSPGFSRQSASPQPRTCLNFFRAMMHVQELLRQISQTVRGRFLNIWTRKQPNRYIILPPQSMASGRLRLKHPEVNSWIPLNSKTSGFKQIFYTTSAARWGWPPSTYLKMSP